MQIYISVQKLELNEEKNIYLKYVNWVMAMVEYK